MFCTIKRHRPCPNDSDSDSDNDTAVRPRCISCREGYIPHSKGLCKECCDGIVETEIELLEERDVLKAKVDFLRLSSSLGNGSNSGSFTDVLLIASDAEASDGAAAAPPIYAHKAVLMSRSPVFKAMLENEMEESRSGIIKISEVSSDALRTFVNYLYTAEASLDEEMAYDLLIMSEKYQVNYLKSECEKFLISKLNPEKSLKWYVFAHQYNAKNLLDASLLEIFKNMEMVTKSEEYGELKKKGPRLVVEIFEAYLSKQVEGVGTSETCFSQSLSSWPDTTYSDLFR